MLDSGGRRGEGHFNKCSSAQPGRKPDTARDDPPETCLPPSRLTWVLLPLSLQVFHEQGILFGYRHPQSSATACILSLFQMTNETLNIWTHLLPFWYGPAPRPAASFHSGTLGARASLNTVGAGRAEMLCGDTGDSAWCVGVELRGASDHGCW